MLPSLIVAIVLIAKLSWYDPSICHIQPVNYYNPAEWWKMAGGADARKWYNRALACPQSFPLWTRFHIEGSRWGLADGDYTCLDRGGAVTVQADAIVLDILRHDPIWGEKIKVSIEFPDDAQYTLNISHR